MEILKDDTFSGLIGIQMEKLAPLLSKISLPVDRQGNINPQALVQMLAQGLVAQRFMQVQMDLEVFKLTNLCQYLMEHPQPTVGVSQDYLISLQKDWMEQLCKCLHKQLEEYANNIINSLQEAQKQQESKIIVPGSNVQVGLVRPK